jgi:CubicO group peptidase (beta-lactamase class C family)
MWDDVVPSVERILEITGCAGASVGIIQNHSVVSTINLGYADVEAGRKPTSATIYGLGSLTKGIVAGAIASLVAEGKLQYSTKVKTILPEFTHRNKYLEEELTVLDLLSHRSGLSGFVPVSMAFEGDGQMLLSKDQLFQIFADLPQDEPLRSTWSYLLWGYSVAGSIISKLSEQPLHEYLQSSIFKPLGMDSTGVQVSKFEQSPLLAKPYGALSNAKPFALPYRQSFEDTFFEASGGVYSSIDDMMKWSKELLSQLDEIKSEAGSEARLPSLRDTTSNHVPVGNPSIRESSYGMGWVRVQLPGFVGLVGDIRDVWETDEQNPVFSTGPESRLMIYHQGATVGYYSCLLLFPETGSAVVVLTNTAALGDAADWIARTFAESLFQKPDPTNYEALAEKYRHDHLAQYAEFQRRIDEGRDPSAKPKDFSAYVGKYHHGKLPYVIDILRDPDHEGQLLLRFQSQELQTYQLRPYRDNIFDWSMARDEVVKRGRYHWWDPVFFQMRFEGKSFGKFTELVWNIDPDAPAPETFQRGARDDKL